MADISDYARISEEADGFRELISSVIRDLCHAYLALADRGSTSSCVGTLAAARTVLYEALEEPVPRLKAKDTGISSESLKRTLFGITRTAEQIFRMFEAVDEEGVPDNIMQWLTTRGKQLLKGLTYLISDLLTERNLHQIMNKLNPPG